MEKMENVPTASLNIVVQVNGKKQAVISVERKKSRSEIEILAHDEPAVKEILKAQKILKIIFVKDKLINFVI